MDSVYIVVGCDTDPDRRGMLDGVPATGLAWRGMTEGIPLLKNAVRGIADSAGRQPAFTWLLRGDEQIREIHGSYAYVAQAHGEFLRGLEESGDELGWHPHFWRRRTEKDPWRQDADDTAWQVEMLRGAHRELSAALPRPLRSVRMGWDYHNNATFASLEELGITVDFSAIPGFRTFVGHPREGKENLFDWHSSPREPYHPSRADYRRPARGDEDAVRTLEVPNFVSTSAFWGLVSGIQLARKTREMRLLWQALRRPTYWINVTALPRFFAPLVTELGKALRGRKGSGHLVVATYFHPDELLPNRSGMYSLQSVGKNIESLLHACAKADIAVKFVTAGQLPAILSARG